MSNDVVVIADTPETIVTIPIQPVPVIETAKLGVLYHAPLATTLTPGIVQIGEGLLVSAGVVSVNSDIIKIEQISLNGNIIAPDSDKIVKLIVDKAEVGLGNVDNTADLDKPVSTATALELNKKFDKQQNIVNFGKILYINENGQVDFKTENVEINQDAFVAVSLNTTNGVLTFTKKDGTTVNVDFPLEELVSDGYYDTTTEEIVLILANGSEIRFSASALVNIYEGDEDTVVTYIDSETGANKIKVSDAVMDRLAAVETSASNNALAITQEITDRSDADTLLQQAVNLKANKTAAMGDFTVTVNNTGTQLTFQRKDVNGDNLGTTKTVSLPDAVVSGVMDTTNKKIVLTLASGGVVNVNMADYIDGVQTQIDAKVDKTAYVTSAEVDALF
mgnify:CR=1 FL=1